MSASQNMARKTTTAVFWNAVSFGLGKGLVFVTMTILARLLTPAQFGIVGFATLAVNYLSVLKDFGLGSALIQRQERVEESADTVFTLNLILGIGLSLFSAGIAPLVATFFDEPLVTPILRLLGLTFALNALGAVHTVRLQRELHFQRKLIPDVGSSVVKGLVSIGLALTGFGVWSLVWGQLAGTAIGVILAWVVFPWRPRLRIVPAVTRALLRFGTTLLGVDGLAVISDNMDYLIIGGLLGKTALGIYTLAYRLPELLVLNILWVMAAALFPAYSKVQDQPKLLQLGFLLTLRYVEVAAVPLCIGLMITADPLVRVAFGEQWLDAIPVVRVLALFVLVRSVGSNVGDVYKAIGRPDILLKLGLVNAGILTLSLLIGVQYGIIGIAWGQVVAGVFRTIFRLAVATRIINVTATQIIAELKPAFFGAMALLTVAIPLLNLTTTLAPLPRLLAIALPSAVVYGTVLWLLEKQFIYQFFSPRAETRI